MNQERQALILAALIVNMPIVSCIFVVLWDQWARGGTWMSVVAFGILIVWILGLLGIVCYLNWRERRR